MRLSNRIAATALAAVMAVSMLTACGGGGGGSTGGSSSSSSKPAGSTSTSTSTSASTSTSTSTSGSGTETAQKKQWKETKTYSEVAVKYRKGKINAAGTITETGKDETLYKYVTDGKKEYSEIRESGAVMSTLSDGTNVFLTISGIDATSKKNVSYSFKMPKKIAEEMLDEINPSPLNVARSIKIALTLQGKVEPKEMTVEQNKKIGAETYYAESFKYSGDVGYYCFKGTQLKKLLIGDPDKAANRETVTFDTLNDSLNAKDFDEPSDYYEFDENGSLKGPVGNPTPLPTATQNANDMLKAVH